MNINDKIELDIISYGSNGEGIGYSGGCTVFVNRVAVGDKIKAKVTFVKKTVAYARPIKLLSGGTGRTEPLCPVYGKCGGCQLQHLSYNEQLIFKKALVKNNLKKIGGIDCEIPDVIPSAEIWRYRNKLNMPFGETDGKTLYGLFKNDTHEIIPVGECLLQQSWAKELVETVADFMTERGITAYDENSGKGLIRHVVARRFDGQLLGIIVINGGALPDADILLSRLKNKFGEVGLFININKKRTNVILGAETKHIGGIEAICGEQFGVKFTVRPQSFYQVNEDIKNKIYTKVRELLKLSDVDVLIDAYSGVGILSGALYSEKYKTYAIEIEPSAVSDAEEMKKRNNLYNLTNVCGDVEKELVKIADTNAGKNIALVVDPPRKGLGESVVKTIISAKPKQIAYISCDSATLARDLKMLIGGGYSITYLQPYDMFPQTRHVECVVLMSRLKD